MSTPPTLVTGRAEIIKWSGEPSFDCHLSIYQGELLQDLELANRKLWELSSTDALTQVGNRYFFDTKLTQAWQQIQETRGDLALIMCDVDYFKAFNDSYGHPAGDRCLQEIAKAMVRALKHQKDLVTRYGGEEFAIILPYTDLAGAEKIASEIQQAVAALKIPHLHSPTTHVTISMGITAITQGQQQSLMSLVEEADKALYEAKAAGKNQYRVRGSKLEFARGEIT